MDRFVILSGCSGGGKSSLLAALAQRGFATVEEPGRRIVVDELRNGGAALPWIDMTAFANRAIEIAIEDRSTAPNDRIVFFDRSLIDAASALRMASGDRFIETLKKHHRYNTHVFMTPPWPEIYVNDAERQHGLELAVEEYERLLHDYKRLDYETIILPKISIAQRADAIIAQLACFT